MLLRYPSQVVYSTRHVTKARAYAIRSRKWGAHRPAPRLQERSQHRRSAAGEVHAEADSLVEAQPGADPGSALTGNEPTAWRRLTNLVKFQNEQGYFMGPSHWQPHVDNTPGILMHEESSQLNPRISVRQHGPFRALRLGDCLHSVTLTKADMSGRAVAVAEHVPFGYIRAMTAVAAALGSLTGVWPGDRGTGRIGNLAVCLGVGGGSLPALLAYHYPQTLIQAVEIDPVIVDVARRFMSLSNPVLAARRNLLVQEGDARTTVFEMLQPEAAPPDTIMLDCYDGEGAIPVGLSGPTFLQACARVLKPGGLLLTNLFNNNPGSQARLRVAHFAVHLQDIVGHGNVYSVKAVNQEVNVILIAVKPPAEGSKHSSQPYSRHDIIQAADDAGREAGFKFSAAEELMDLFCIHADSVASFHETRA